MPKIYFAIFLKGVAIPRTLMYNNICSDERKAYSSLAQSVEHAAVNRSVVGSSPTGGAT